MSRTPQSEAAWWSLPPERLLASLRTSASGLTQPEAAERRLVAGPNALKTEARAVGGAHILLHQFRSPLVLILLLASVVGLAAGDRAGTAIILVMLSISSALGFFQEYRAARELRALRTRLGHSSRVRRNHDVITLPSVDLVPGDVVELSAGSLVPADGVLLEAKDCFVIQSMLTGESTPVEKTTLPTAADSSPIGRTNVLYMGTSIRSGTATLLVVQTGGSTLYGEIAAHLQTQRPETDFERGIRHLSALMAQFVLILTIIVLSINLWLHRPPIESILFAIALAVGITPELLPAIVSINLARGARQLAARGVLIRNLSAIENLGGMTVLCSDKTGTLTQGTSTLNASIDSAGRPSSRVLALGILNARLQAGFPNPLDEIISSTPCDDALLSQASDKLAEQPYDFVRKRLSVSVRLPNEQSPWTITKGAATAVLEVCTFFRSQSGIQPLDAETRAAVLKSVDERTLQGFRVIGVASRQHAQQDVVESAMTFEGLLLFEDPVKPDIRETLEALRSLSVHLKIITGDHRNTAAHVAREIGIGDPEIVTGDGLQDMSDEALWHLAPRTDVFAEVDPNQKERIIRALRRNGHVVGYLGDGINDAPALHAADVGISVDGAVDVAREAADIVLLRHDLEAIVTGIRQGRATFVNTQKYILVATSANLGNMISMAIAAAFLPFLPMLAVQILLNNLLSDIPAAGLAGDRIDPELVRPPSRWNIARIRIFSIVFGGVSSVFDLLTFVTLYSLLGGAPAGFRSGWFLESLGTQVLTLLIVRTRRSIFRSAPTPLLLWIGVASIGTAYAMVQTPLGRWFEFSALPRGPVAAIFGITIAYVIVLELLKRPLNRLALRKGRREARNNTYVGPDSNAAGSLP